MREIIGICRKTLKLALKLHENEIREVLWSEDMQESIQKYLLLKLNIMKKLEKNLDQEQTAIFDNDLERMNRILEERKKELDLLSEINKMISDSMDSMGVFSIIPQKYPLLYRIKRKIDNSLREIEKKNALNKMMIQFIAMHTWQ